MNDILEICAGLDVHQKVVVACVLDGRLNQQPQREIETFETNTEGLLRLLDWLEKRKCSHVAMESTGVYWKPIWNILETGDFELILANAHQIKNLPGRKTDVKDAEWIAQLLRSGLINKSFVPEAPIRDLRDLTRYRKKLVYEMNAEKNRVHKILQDCNIKLTSHISDIFGDTGRQIIECILKNKNITRKDIEEMVQGRGKGKIKNKVEDILKSLNGKVREHHRIMIRYSYNHIQFIEKQVAEVERKIEELAKDYRREIEILDTIPGIDSNSAAIIVAEIGVDMNQFPHDKHLSSWAGLSPGNNESAGKKKRSSVVQGNKYLKTVLCECAWVVSHKKDTRLSITYWKWVKRMGKKKANIALANLMLRICYHMLKNQTAYIEVGDKYYKTKESEKEKKLIKELEEKGYTIQKVS